MKAKNKMKILKIITIIILITHFSCHISLAAEMSASNLTYLTDNIVAWKNIDNANIVLANSQDIAKLETKRNVEIQEQEEEIITSNNLDICLILDCSGSMYTTVGNTTRLDKLKSATKKLLEGLRNDYQLRVTLITYGEDFDGPTTGEDVFADYFAGGWYGGRRLLNFEKNMNKILDVIDDLPLHVLTPTGEAIDFADKCWTSAKDLDLASKVTVLVTDGLPNRSY